MAFAQTFSTRVPIDFPDLMRGWGSAIPGIANI